MRGQSQSETPFLATTALTEFWDTGAENILFLGNWCLRGDRQQDWQHLNYEILPHPWDDREAMHQAARIEEELYEELLPVLGDFLNEVHGAKHQEKYWRIILGPWLLHYIQVLHERYLCLTRALECYPQIRTLGLADSSCQTPRFFWDHVHGSIDDPYNLQLYTAILQAMGHRPPLREKAWCWEHVAAGGRNHWRDLLRQLPKLLWRQWSFCWAKKAPFLLVDMHIPRKQVLQLMATTRFQTRWCTLPEAKKWLEAVSPDHLNPRRRDLDKVSPKTTCAFSRVLIQTLPVHFPLMYLEGYPACRDWIRERWQKSRTKTVLTANAFIGNETFKILAAELGENGTKLIDIQHGGSYGVARYNPIEKLSRKTAHEFWTWGWGENTPVTNPMPNPKLAWIIQKRLHHKNNQEPYIFYVGNIIPRYHYRTWSYPTAHQALSYFDWQIRFLATLKPETRGQLIFRPHPEDYGWGVRKRLQAAFPSLRLQTPPADYYDGLVNASLVVCDMNQTTLLESMAANIPTIAFWDPNFSELRPEAEAYFHRLQEVGIFYDNPEQAAQAVSEKSRDLQWWTQDKLQQARSEFAQRFALTSTRWHEEWREALQKLAQREGP